MRKIGIAIGVILLIIIVAVVVFAATFNVNKYRGTIQSELQKQLGRQVTLGDMHLGLFPPSLKVKDVAIADDPRFNTAKPFVEANELDVSIKLLPLLHKAVEINSLNLQRPSVELIKNQQGIWNFASIGHPEQSGTQPTSPEPQQPAPAKGKQSSKEQAKQKPEPSQPTNPSGSSQPQQPSSSGQQFSLGDLVIKDGQVSLTDMQKSKTPVVYDHIDVTLKDFAPDRPFTIDAAAHLPGAGNQEVRLQGKGGPLQQNNPATTPFDGTLNLKQVEIAGLSKFLNSPALVGTNGIVSGETKINSQSGNANVEGQTTIKNAKIQGTDIPYPIVADYKLTDNLVSDLLTIHDATIKLGSTPVNINGTMNSKSTPAQIDMNIKVPNASLAEMAKLAAASGKALSPGTDVTGNVNANINAKGAADKPALNGTITANNVQMTGKDVPQPVQVSNVKLALTPNQIQSNNFNITSGQTTVNALLTLKNYTSNNPLVDATLKAPNAQLPALLAMAKAYGVKNVDKLQGQGTLNLDMHAVGPVKSLSGDEIMRALNGNMNVNFANVKYSGADISHELGAIAGFLGKANTSTNSTGITNIVKMTGNILVKNGIAQTNNLQALLDIGNLGVTGTANLVDQALNLRVNAVLSQQFTQKLGGGSGVGGFMQTALANNSGELVIPAIVTGTFDHPKFAPDVQQVAQMKLKGLMPNFNNPTQGVGGLVGSLLGQKNNAQGQQQQQAEPNQQQNVEGAAQQILGGLFGKKKQQQPKK
jgi:uncharacterized protein involved in outer membrane biogenesis